MKVFLKTNLVQQDRDAQRYQLLRDYLLQNGIIRHVALSTEASEPFAMGAVLVQTSELAWAATMTGMPARQQTPELFKGLHFDHEVVILCVRWYLSYKLSSRDLVNMMAERSVELAHTTILRWVQRYVPEFEKRWNRYARTVDGSWRCDETYIKVKGRWTYLYRAVDKQGRTVDFLLSAKRDVAAAKRFFQKAMKGNG